MARDIYVTENDYDRLENLVAATGGRDKAHVERLAEELERAHIVPAAEIPPDVVTMNSEIELKDLDTGETMTFTVVFPYQANFEQGRVSVLAPLGTAVLGYRAGDVVEWTVPGRTRRLKIERVLFQPEAAQSSSG
ncbi:MAG TPA: nucleoside diphosphate kinase regulator [Vicinamibacterales bacterium]